MIRSENGSKLHHSICSIFPIQKKGFKLSASRRQTLPTPSALVASRGSWRPSAWLRQSCGNTTALSPPDYRDEKPKHPIVAFGNKPPPKQSGFIHTNIYIFFRRGVLKCVMSLFRGLHWTWRDVYSLFVFMCVYCWSTTSSQGKLTWGKCTCICKHVICSTCLSKSTSCSLKNAQLNHDAHALSKQSVNTKISAKSQLSRLD